MKEHTEKQPIDDLFARKLGDMSIKPSTDAFSRLQTRMGQDKREEPVMFWRNPVVQRYMAAAACLLLITSFGWLYISSNRYVEPNEVKVAATRLKDPSSEDGRVASKPKQENTKATAADASQIKRETPQIMSPAELEQSTNEEQLTQTITPSSTLNRSAKPQAINKTFQQKVDAKDPVKKVESESVLAQSKPLENGTKEEIIVKTATTSASTTLERLANKTEPTQSAERVLVVTISEPQTLIAARQAAIASIEEKSAVAVTDKLEKENKSGNLWSQVKRIKQGEIFARQNTDEDDRGLLGRAYSGIKHNFEKDKSVKQ